MKFVSSLLLCALVIPLIGCAYDPLKPVDPVHAIAPGIYGNIRSLPDGGLRGYELRLPQGGMSSILEVTQCNGSCSPVYRQPLLRQGDVVRFALPMGGDAATRVMELTPMAGGMLMLSGVADRGAEGAVLRPTRRETGLAAARREAIATPPRP